MKSQDELYTVGPPPTFSKEKWFQLKPSLPLDFPNLPYLYDGDVKISQSVTIMRYLGRKFDLWPANEQQAIRVDLIEQQLIDYRSAGTQVFYNPDFDKLKDDYIVALNQRVSALAKFLGSNDYLAGDKLTYVDFLAYEWLDVNRTLVPSLLDSHESLNKFTKRIESISKVKEYMESPRFMKYPFNNDQAKWGSALTAPGK